MSLLEGEEDYRNWHGHIRVRPDGLRAKCGSVRMCPVCQAEQREHGEPMGKAIVFLKAHGARADRKKYPIAYRQKWRGFELAIENPVGSVRSGKKPNGTAWHTKMSHAYGEITDTEGADGDPVDIFVGPDLDAPMVFVVHQNTVDDWDKYDEDKVMLGFASEADAKSAFLKNYDDPRFLGPITAMPVAEFIKKARATKDKPGMIKALVLFITAASRP